MPVLKYILFTALFFLFGNSIMAAPTQKAEPSGFTLASGGKSLCSIVVNFAPYGSAKEASDSSGAVNWFDADFSDDTVCTESFAAMELRHYLCAMTGLDENDPAVFPIRGDRDTASGNVIIVGNEISNRQVAPFAAELGFVRGGTPSPRPEGPRPDGPRPDGSGPEGFRLKTVKKADGFAILLAGYDRVGTLYAVYDFLDRCGVRWFSPGLTGESVPKRPVLRIPALNVTDAPKFTLRGFWAEFFVSEHTHVVAQGKKGNLDFFDWMARNRMNLWSAGEMAVPPGEMKKRGLHLNAGGHTFYTLLNPKAPYPYNHPRFPGDDSKPTDPYAAGSEFKGDVNGDGVLSYSEAHPEWYGLAPDGQRKFPTDPFGYNFCTSNDDMVKEFLKKLVAKLADGEWKYADYLDWWPEDADNWCVCENCKKLGIPTDRNILMAHRIRQELKRAHEDGRLGRDIIVNFLLYNYAGVIDPPTKPLPEGFDYSGLATFFPITRCYVHNFDDPACTEYNKPYDVYLKAWLKSPYYKGKFMIGEYYNISGYRDLPILYTRVMTHDIRYYYESGARAMHYMHVSTGNWGPHALTNYQFARMLWNPYTDVPKLLDEYFRLRYGPASPTMHEFYTALEQTMINVPVYKYQLNRSLHDFANGKTNTIFPQKHLRLEVFHPATDDGPDMDETVRNLAACERIMDRALTLSVDDRIRAHILEDEGMLRYAAATVRLYWFMARAAQHPVKSTEWKHEVEHAAIQADYLDCHPVGYAAVHGGTMDMMRNALDASGIRDVYEKWRNMLRE